MEGMFLINVTPWSAHKTIGDYADFLLKQHIYPHFRNGTTELHLLFDDPECLQTYRTIFVRKKLNFANSPVPSDDSFQPVYENPPAKYNAERIIKILLQPDETRVCYVKPSAVIRSASYVVDVRNLQNQDNIKDEFGIWNYSGSRLRLTKCTMKKMAA